MGLWEVAGCVVVGILGLALGRIGWKLWGPSKYNKYDRVGEIAGVRDCLFCGFVRDMERPVYEDDFVLAFNDISPFATRHILLIPKRHIKNLLALKKEDLGLLEHMKDVAQKLDSGLGTQGADFIFHKSAFNSILHLHLHIMFYPLTRPFLRRIIFNPLFCSTIDSTISGLKTKST
jgi:histidine triad (HIT) family protein